MSFARAVPSASRAHQHRPSHLQTRVGVARALAPAHTHHRPQGAHRTRHKRTRHHVTLTQPVSCELRRSPLRRVSLLIDLSTCTVYLVDECVRVGGCAVRRAVGWSSCILHGGVRSGPTLMTGVMLVGLMIVFLTDRVAAALLLPTLARALPRGAPPTAHATHEARAQRRLFSRERARAGR